jgi:hypothetical protein
MMLGIGHQYENSKSLEILQLVGHLWYNLLVVRNDAEESVVNLHSGSLPSSIANRFAITSFACLAAAMVF